MKHSNAAYEIYGMEYHDFEIWCKRKKLPTYKIESKKEFFNLARMKKIVKVNGILKAEEEIIND